MTTTQGPTQSLNLTSEELKAVHFALQWSYLAVANAAPTERKWAKNRKTINGVVAKVKALLSEGI